MPPGSQDHSGQVESVIKCSSQVTTRRKRVGRQPLTIVQYRMGGKVCINTRDGGKKKGLEKDSLGTKEKILLRPRSRNFKTLGRSARGRDWGQKALRKSKVKVKLGRGGPRISQARW